MFAIAAAFHVVLERPARAGLTSRGRARESLAVAMESGPPPAQRLQHLEPAEAAQPPFGSGVLLSDLAAVRRSRVVKGTENGGTWPVQHSGGRAGPVPQVRRRFHSSVRRLRSGFEVASPPGTM